MMRFKAMQVCHFRWMNAAHQYVAPCSIATDLEHVIKITQIISRHQQLLIWIQAQFGEYLGIGKAPDPPPRGHLEAVGAPRVQYKSVPFHVFYYGEQAGAEGWRDLVGFEEGQST